MKALTGPRLIICALIVLSTLLSLSPSVAAQVCLPPPGGLVVWLPGNGNEHEVAGRNPTTLQNGATFAATGKVGQSFSVDGVNDFIQLTAPIYTAAGGTVDLWFKRTAGSGVMIGSYGGSGERRAPTLYVAPTGKFGWEFGSLHDQDTGQTINLNQWYHAALTYD